MNATTSATPVANLRNTKREMAAAVKKAAPKPAPKAPAKAPAKKVPAKKAAPKAASTKLRWQVEAGVERTPAGYECHATSGDRTYAITRSGDKWQATRKRAGKTAVLGDAVSFGRAYALIMADNKAAK